MSGPLPMAVDGRNLTYRYGQFTAVDDVTFWTRSRATTSGRTC
jgi:ABC-2 type transport system ATP-binding protein